MTDHIKVNENYIASLFEGAAWDAAGVKFPVEEDATTEVVEEGKAEVVEEAEVHSCPLCESVLAEDLTEEQLLEHLEMISEIIESLNEEAEEVEEMQEKKKDDGESKGDKGKDKDDPEAKDYEDGGDRKGDKSKTKKGKKDFMDKIKAKTKKADC
jgi:predicted house-cleaning noncanonical NTP pyrophosphatase (MazG superfamily)